MHTKQQKSMNSYLKSKIASIDARLDQLVTEQKGFPHASLYAAARYALFTGGKRVRPILALAACQAVGGSEEKALTPACALEMIHAYSLIHDDLPCMDNDDFRRGKPTVHKVFPEPLALLAGDFLLTKAFEVVAESPGLESAIKVALVQILARQSGGDGMIGGQVIDIDPKQQTLDLEQLQQMHLLKTGALIQASIEFGARIGGASPDLIEHLNVFGQKIGLAFQVIDDVIDVVSPEAKHGKSSDAENHKTTYVSLLGVEGAKQCAEQLMEEAVAIVRGLPIDSDELIHLTEYLARRTI